MKIVRKTILPILILCCLLLSSCSPSSFDVSDSAGSFSLDAVPAFSDAPYVVINDNIPEFAESDLTTTSFEQYAALDAFGRCGVAYANVGTDTMPTEERGSIGQVKPSGWQTVKYDFVDGKYLYNRCHLIGYQLTAENANKENLITGTRYLNIKGMLPFENMVADYVKETGNHVLYRVTPIFEGENLVAKGVQMEAKSVEDDGEGICYNVFCYNSQPGVVIDYATGESHKAASASGNVTYILNTNTYKFHDPVCALADDIKESNRQEYDGNRDTLIAQGYEPCGRCKP
ncbi:MAG: DNA/RNA non-specific endonuclease [Oscillospiraceae bacterium]|jgi:DNA-entry nuclease